jgi:hypothetical protein
MHRLPILKCYLILTLFPIMSAQQAVSNEPIRFPYPEALSYRVGWRMITAGSASLRLTAAPSDGWQLNLDLTSAGFVNQLYHVLDHYKLLANGKFCGVTANLDAQEGKRHSLATLTFDNEKHKLVAITKDLAANTTHTADLDIPPCTYDIAGALMTLRATQLDPGMKLMLPVTEGKKLASVKVEGLSREKLALNGKNYSSIRYETFIFNNVLYRRKGRLLVWLSDDSQRIPLRLRFIFGFPLGDITLELEKVEKL